MGGFWGSVVHCFYFFGGGGGVGGGGSEFGTRSLEMENGLPGPSCQVPCSSVSSFCGTGRSISSRDVPRWEGTTEKATKQLVVQWGSLFACRHCLPKKKIGSRNACGSIPLDGFAS